MKKTIAGAIILLITNFAVSSELPDWAKSVAKNGAIDQLIESMHDGPFYKITKIEVTQIKPESEHAVVNVKIDFDDSFGCKARYLNLECIVFGDGLDCGMGMTDCLSPGSLRKNKIRILNL